MEPVFISNRGRLKRKMAHRIMGILLSAAVAFNMLPAGGFAAHASEGKAGLCEHHTAHTDDCGYTEETPGTPCGHEHTEDCYTEVTECVHEHTPECYPEETEDSVSGNEATPANAKEREPENCPHICDGESGCITETLNCQHEHKVNGGEADREGGLGRDGDCGYTESTPGTPCTFVCEICNPQDSGEAGKELETGIIKQEQCSCLTLCTEGQINPDCPVCGAEDAGLSDCKGEAVEENAADVEENADQPEDTGVCKHHQEHDDACGYQPESEDSEGSPCTYACRICPIEALIAALPEQVAEDNAADVRAQLDRILDLYRELNEDEQEEIDLSRATELQGALDGANAPMAAEGRTEQQDTDEASVTINGETLYYATLEEAFAAANRQTATITMLTDAECVHSGSNGSPLNINGGNVTLNLNGKTLSGKGSGYYGIINVSGGSLLVQGEEGKVNVTMTGLSCRGSGKLTVEGITLELVGDNIGVANAGVENSGGTVVLNGTQITGAASDGQIYHYSGTTTINNVTATGTTENHPKSVWYCNEGTLTINGGTFDKIVVESGNGGGVQSVAELLGEGCAYKKQDGTWATADEMAGLEISNVTVEKIPLTINPNGDTSWYYSTQQTHTLAMNAAPVSGGTVTYVWKNGEETLDCTSDAYTVPAGMPVGSYTYTCEATCDGYTLSHTFTFKIEKSGTDLTSDGKVKTYKDGAECSDFTAGDTITVKATPTPTGDAPQKAAARLRADPTEGQMVVYVGTTQVSVPADKGEDGTYTMEVSAADVLLAAGGPDAEITLTAKFVENDNMADGTGTVKVNITAVAVAEKDGKVIGYYGESNLDDAFTNDGATATLLADVKRANTLTIKVNCTLDLGGHNITFTGIENVWVQGSVTAMTIRGEGEIVSEQSNALAVNGSVTLEGGTFTSNGENSAGVYVNSASASLSVTGEYVTIRNTGGGYGLAVNYAQSVQLSAGTYKGEKAVSIVSGTTTLGDLLAHSGDTRYAYYQGDALVTTGLDGQALPSGSYTVKACTHTGEGVCTYTHNENTSNHTKTCLACGYTETGDCGFEKTADSTADSHTGQCPNCKRDRSGAHSFSDWAGNPVARTCTVCGYEQTAVARVEKDSTTTYVGALADAFTEGNSGATVTLLSEVDLGSNYIGIRGSSTFTLDLNGRTVKASHYGAFDISGGSLTIQDSGTGGKIESSNITIGITGGTLSVQSGTVSGFYGVKITSGTVNISGGVISGTEKGLWVNGGGNIVLSGGAYSGRHAIWVDANVSVTLKDLLASECAYHSGDTPIPLQPNGKKLTGTVTVKACTHTGEGVCTYTHIENTSTHTKTCLACGQTLGTENCTYSFSGGTGTCAACRDSVAVAVSGTEGLVYDGTGKEPGVTVTRGETALTAGAYTVAYADNINSGTAKVTVTIGNSQGTYTGNFNIGKAGLTITASAQTITYGGSITTGTDQVTATGLASGDTLESVTLEASTANVPGGNITPSSAVIKRGGEDVTANYNITYQPGTLAINRAQGTLTVPAGPVTKTFGDGKFLLGCSTNGDGKISYASSDENVASVSADGNVLIKGAGEAVITVSLADGTNYTGAESQEVRITVAKAAAPAIPGETRNYTCLNGSHGAVTIDVAGKLPKDRGETAYTAAATDGKGILSGVSIDQDGNLVYTVEGNKAAGDTAVITVTAVMANYGDTACAVTIGLVEKIAVNVTLTAQPQDSVYDGNPHNGYAGFAAQTVNGSYTGAVRFWYAGAGGTSYGSDTPPVRAGSYTVTASVPEDDAEYAGASEAVPFTIRRAAITIKADNKTAQAGSPLPELTYTVSGLAENEQLKAAPELSCSADMNTAGIYPVMAGGAEVPDTKNYFEEITYENGTLTVLDSAVHVTGVSLDKSALSLAAGSAARLTAALSPENATDRSVSWVSGNPAVASVDGSGNITAVSAGTAVITVTAADGGYTASCTVTVRKSTGGSSGGGNSGSTGSGSSGGTGSSGGANTGSGTGQAVKQPFIKDSSGREGWDVIRAEARKAAAAPAGGTVAVDMNGAVSVPGSVFESIRGKNVTISLDMGSGIAWSVNGKDITAENISDTDFSVKADAGAIPKELIAGTAGGLAHLELSLAHEGGFGFTATLTLRIVSRGGNGITAGSSGAAAEYTGMYANLFYYNKTLRSLEFICAGQVGEDGTADLPFTHASDYTVILSAAPMGGTGMPGNPQKPEETEKPQEPVKKAVGSVKLSRTLYTYNGKPKKPSVTAVDTEGRKIPAAYYTVSYQNNKKAGKATVTVRFKDGYSGTVKKTFTIRPAGTSIQKLTASSGGFTVKWKKKTAQVSGYQIRYSAGKGFKGSSTRSVSVKKASVTKKEVKNLKAGKKYYVRIRTYKTVKADGKNTKVYSAWSGTVRVRALPASGGKNTASAVRAGAFPAAKREDGRKREA